MQSHRWEKETRDRTYAKPENSVYHGAIGAVRGFGLGIDQIHSSYYIPHLPGKCVSPTRERKKPKTSDKYVLASFIEIVYHIRVKI